MQMDSSISQHALFTPDEVATELDIPLHFVYELLETGALSSLKLGRRRDSFRISSHHVEALRADLTPQIRDYVQERTEPAPAFEIPLTVEQEPSREWDAVTIPPKTSWSVYVLHMAPFYKIGVSVNPAQRIASIAGSLPIRPRLVALLVTHCAPDLEEMLHGKYAACRVNGEWFTLRNSQVEYLITLGRRFVCCTVYSNIEGRGGWAWRAVEQDRRYPSLEDLCDGLVADTTLTISLEKRYRRRRSKYDKKP